MSQQPSPKPSRDFADTVRKALAKRKPAEGWPNMPGKKPPAPKPAVEKKPKKG